MEYFGLLWTTLEHLAHLVLEKLQKDDYFWDTLYIWIPGHLNIPVCPWQWQLYLENLQNWKSLKINFWLGEGGELCIAVYLKPSQSQSSPSSIWLKPAILLPPHPDVQSVKCLPTAQFYTFRNLPVKRINRDILCSKFRQEILLTS